MRQHIDNLLGILSPSVLLWILVYDIVSFFATVRNNATNKLNGNILLRMRNMQELTQKKNKLEDELKAYKEKRLEMIATGQSYQIANGDDSRQLTNVSLSELNSLIDETERKINDLEYMINHNGRGKYCVSLGVKW